MVGHAQRAMHGGCAHFGIFLFLGRGKPGEAVHVSDFGGVGRDRRWGACVRAKTGGARGFGVRGFGVRGFGVRALPYVMGSVAVLYDDARSAFWDRALVGAVGMIHAWRDEGYACRIALVGLGLGALWMG